MKTLFTLIALGSVALVSAGQSNPNYGNSTSAYPSYNNGRGYNQTQPNNGYYQQNQPQSSQGYYDPKTQTQYFDQTQQNNGNTYGYRNGDSQKIVSDQDISNKIKPILSAGWFTNGHENVSYDVNNGNVNLSGSVDSTDNKNKVEESVRKIDGVKQVNNQISVVPKVNPAYTDEQLQKNEKKYPQDAASSYEDRQLNAYIRERLSGGWFSKNYDTIQLRTANGVVVISGTLDKPDDIQKINDLLIDIPGARTVNMQIRANNR